MKAVTGAPIPFRTQMLVYLVAFFAGSQTVIVAVVMPLWALQLGATPGDDRSHHFGAPGAGRHVFDPRRRTAGPVRPAQRHHGGGAAGGRDISPVPGGSRCLGDHRPPDGLRLPRSHGLDRRPGAGRHPARRAGDLCGSHDGLHAPWKLLRTDPVGPRVAVLWFHGRLHGDRGLGVHGRDDGVSAAPDAPGVCAQRSRTRPVRPPPSPCRAKP